MFGTYGDLQESTLITIFNMNNWQELINKGMDYVLYTDGEGYILEVPCGTVAVYDLRLRLNEAETQRYLNEGERFLDEFADQIRTFPSRHYDRHIR